VATGGRATDCRRIAADGWLANGPQADAVLVMK